MFTSGVSLRLARSRHLSHVTIQFQYWACNTLLQAGLIEKYHLALGVFSFARLAIQPTFLSP